MLETKGRKCGRHGKLKQDCNLARSRSECPGEYDSSVDVAESVIW